MLMTIFRVAIIVLAFVGINYAISKTRRVDAEAECKGHNLAEEKRQREKGKWNYRTVI